MFKIIIAVFVGFYLGVLVMALMFVSSKPCDHYLPDIKDVQVE